MVVTRNFFVGSGIGPRIATPNFSVIVLNSVVIESSLVVSVDVSLILALCGIETYSADTL